MYDELLWSTTADRRLSNGVPSWSWLSLDGSVSKLYHIAAYIKRTARVHADAQAPSSFVGNQVKITAAMVRSNHVLYHGTDTKSLRRISCRLICIGIAISNSQNTWMLGFYNSALQ